MGLRLNRREALEQPQELPSVDRHHAVLRLRPAELSGHASLLVEPASVRVQLEDLERPSVPSAEDEEPVKHVLLLHHSVEASAARESIPLLMSVIP